MRNIEAIFGGVLALVVLGVALFAVMNTNFGAGPGGDGPMVTTSTSSGSVTAPTLTAVSGQDLVCECYDAAFAMAGQVDVLSPEYRTGFQQCRGRPGGIRAFRAAPMRRAAAPISAGASPQSLGKCAITVLNGMTLTSANRPALL